MSPFLMKKGDQFYPTRVLLCLFENHLTNGVKQSNINRSTLANRIEHDTLLVIGLVRRGKICRHGDRKIWEREKKRGREKEREFFLSRRRLILPQPILCPNQNLCQKLWNGHKLFFYSDFLFMENIWFEKSKRRLILPHFLRPSYWLIISIPYLICLSNQLKLKYIIDEVPLN